MQTYTLYFDGSCWPNPGGVVKFAYVLITPNGKHTDHGIISTDITTNNIAEYVSLSQGLKLFDQITKDNPPCRLNVYGDSQLVINQMNKKWKIKEGSYKLFGVEVIKLVAQIRKNKHIINFTWIPRESNTEADTLSKL